MNIEELHSAVQVWGHARQITINGNKVTQALKFAEELGEVAEGMRLDDPELIKDGVGDCFVVAIMLEGLMPEITIFPLAPAPTNLSLPEMMGKLANDILKDRNPAFALNTMLHQLVLIAAGRGYTLTECLQTAYDEIKDRKGYLNKAGNFIKEADRTQLELEID